MKLKIDLEIQDKKTSMIINVEDNLNKEYLEIESLERFWKENNINK